MLSRFVLCTLLTAMFAGPFAASASADPKDYFGIQAVDADTGRGIPAVVLRTTYKQRYVTDSNGYVAFAEPGLMNQEVWFDVASWGYESPQGPYGTRGVKLKTTPGKIETVKIRRQNIAERLYRLTGYGIYRDTLLLGKKAPIREPLLRSRVTGCDTVQTAVYKGKMRWFWQDTDQLGFSLGNFSMTGATTALPDRLKPDVGLDYEYFAREAGGFVRSMAHVKQEGSLPIWVDGLMVVWDANGNERLISRYAAANKDFTVAHAGLMVYDDEKDVFVELKRIPDHNNTRLYPVAHPFRANVDGVEYYYISNPFPFVRVKADYESASDLSAYEGFTCFKPDAPSELNRDSSGKLLWTWQRGVQPVGPEKVEQLVRDGQITIEETPYQLRDVETGEPVIAAHGSVAWNPYLKKWTLLFGQKQGASNLGEIWFATAAAPEGPWVACRKVASHALKGQNMDFYNPMQHPELMREGGRYVYFEGTFVNTFSGTTTPVPYYDYNQIMYRLDVADPRLNLPEPPPGLGNAQPSTVFVWGRSK